MRVHRPTPTEGSEPPAAESPRSQRPAPTASPALPVSAAPTPDAPLTPSSVLQLQRALGNRAVTQLLRSRGLPAQQGGPSQGAPPPGSAPLSQPSEPRPAAAERNLTGLPDALKSGIEHLSGLSLSDVRVHYNSSEPAQVGALTFARGSEIHVGPGQEQHLPHEAWHVVQQKQGLVQPTTTVNGRAINDDPALEADADRHAARLAQVGAEPPVQRLVSHGAPSEPVLQRKIVKVADNGKSSHVAWGGATNNSLPADPEGSRPIVIEVMEGNVDSAQAKVNQIADSAGEHDNRAIMVAINQRADAKDYDAQTGILKGSASPDGYPKLAKDVTALTTVMERRAVRGGSFPMIWSPTDPKVQKGYTFPFLEARARVTLHSGTAALLRDLQNKALAPPLMRSMDADVSNDPLLTGRLTKTGLAHLNDLGRAAYEEYEGPTAKKPAAEGPRVVSGGYNWNMAPRDATFWLGDPGKNKKHKIDKATELALASWNAKWTGSLRAINQTEHAVRVELNKLLSKLVYWPEPNSYMGFEDRLAGARRALEQGERSGQGAQQREMTYYVKGIDPLKGVYLPEIAATKPVKDYFDPLRELIKASDKAAPKPAEIKAYIESIRQTHLNFQIVQDVLRWNGVEKPLNLPAQAKIKELLAGLVTKLTERLQNILSGKFEEEPSGGEEPSEEQDSEEPVKGKGAPEAEDEASDEEDGEGMVTLDEQGAPVVTASPELLAAYIEDLPLSTAFLSVAEGEILAREWDVKAKVFNVRSPDLSGTGVYEDDQHHRYRATEKQTLSDGDCLIHGLSLIASGENATKEVIQDARRLIAARLAAHEHQAALRSQSEDLVRAIVQGVPQHGLGPSVREVLEADRSIGRARHALEKQPKAKEAPKKAPPSKEPAAGAPGQQIGRIVFNVTYNEDGGGEGEGILLFVNGNHYIVLEPVEE